ncbi:MAG TPA: LysR family transcriptional regulator [Myxococcales bacterium]|nr:LysR family transcriptional regulator [Myxococcales bacterium]
MRAERVEEFRFADLSAVLLVRRLGSVTASARQLGVTPSQVSKAVSRAEASLGALLFSRSSHGLSPTQAGLRIFPRLDEIAAQLSVARGNEEPADSLLTIAAPSYINSLFLPAIAEAVPEMRVRGLELPASLVRTLAPGGLFDVTVLVGQPRLPRTWTATPIGSTRKIVFAPPRIARLFGAGPIAMERLREFRFVSPVYHVGGQFVPVDDDCPLPAALRRRGHEAQTIGAALELAARTGQLVYGPACAGIRQLAAGELTELRVRGWNAQDPIYLACNAERVLARVQRALVRQLPGAVDALEKRTLWLSKRSQRKRT